MISSLRFSAKKNSKKLVYQTIIGYTDLMVSLTGPKGDKAYLDDQVAKSTIEAARYAAAGDDAKAARASAVAAEASLASAQANQQIIESNK